MTGDLLVTLNMKIILNAGHPVYRGHFPERAIAPGVCIIQMIQEIISTHLKTKTKLSESADIKFLKLILPDENNIFDLTCSINNSSEKLLEASALISRNSEIYLKFRGKFNISPF